MRVQLANVARTSPVRKLFAKESVSKAGKKLAPRGPKRGSGQMGVVDGVRLECVKLARVIRRLPASALRVIANNEYQHGSCDIKEIDGDGGELVVVKPESHNVKEDHVWNIVGEGTVA